MKQVLRHSLIVLVLIMLFGCADTDRDSTSTALNWQGRWWGVEGTYLDIAGGPEKFQLTIANLDGPVEYVGVAENDHIRFEFQNATATIRATDGAGSGMKWLLDKDHCLKVELGDGYCRD